MKNVLQKYWVFLLLPGFILGYSILLKLATGPYWLAPNLDPAYQYLVNGVYLVKGLVPNHTDHPGTPLQILSWAVCWIFNIGKPVPEVVTNVLKFPEFYLSIVFAVLSLLTFGTSVGLAIYVFRKTNDKLAAILTQVPALSFLTLKAWESLEPVLPVVVNVSPEPLLIAVINLFSLCLLMSFYAKTAKDEGVAMFCWGVVCGLGAATKLTFLPLLSIPLIVLSWKNRAIFISVFSASFVIWTLPIISKYHIIWGWIVGVTMHKGDYKSGGAGVGQILNYLSVRNIGIEQLVFEALLIGAFAFVGFKIARKKCDRGTIYLMAVAGGILLQFLAVTQHPGAHYLLPGMALFGVLLVLLYLQTASQYVLGRRIVWSFVLIGTLFSVAQASMYRVKLESLTKDMLAFRLQVAAKYPNCTSVDYYRSSSPEAALFFGDGWNLAPQLGTELFSLYPNKFYFQIWGNRILDFNGRVWADDLLVHSPCVIFQGDGDYDFSEGPYDLQSFDKGRFQSVDLLVKTTDKQAALYLSGSLHFFQTGDYQKALICALQARRFHYQPDSSVTSVIQLLEPYLRGQALHS